MKRLKAEHGAVCDLASDTFGYFGWPTVARADNGMLWVSASGMRNGHICPTGRTTIFCSTDNGKSWTTPRVITDTPFDDRDSGILDAGGGRLLVTWFTSNPSGSDGTTGIAADAEHPDAAVYQAGLRWNDLADAADYTGAWVRVSDDGGITWNPPLALEVSAPHGPIRLASGDLLYLGKSFGERGAVFRTGDAPIRALRSSDRGESWQPVGDVPLAPKTSRQNYHEPHVVELADGRLLGHIRIQDWAGAPLTEAGITSFSIMQTISDDGGATWSEPRPLGWHGSPPHLLRHSSGCLVCTYGYRQEGFGQRVALSHDNGDTWEHDFILRDDGPDFDLGYPSTVELPDGSLYSVYYQAEKGSRCALLSSRWNLPQG